MTNYAVSSVTLPRIMGSMKGQTLADLVRQRVDSVYGGNQRAFAKATKMTPQAVYALYHGKVTLPQLQTRRALMRELGVSHLDLFVMAGELSPEEIDPALVKEAAFPPGDPRNDVVELLAELDDAYVSPVKAMTEALVNKGRNPG